MLRKGQARLRPPSGGAAPSLWTKRSFVNFFCGQGLTEVLYTAPLTARALSGADGVSERAQVIRLAIHGVAEYERDRYSICPPKSSKTDIRGAQNRAGFVRSTARVGGLARVFVPCCLTLLISRKGYADGGVRSVGIGWCRLFGSLQDAYPKCVSTLNAFV